MNRVVSCSSEEAGAKGRCQGASRECPGFLELLWERGIQGTESNRLCGMWSKAGFRRGCYRRCCRPRFGFSLWGPSHRSQVGIPACSIPSRERPPEQLEAIRASSLPHPHMPRARARGSTLQAEAASRGGRADQACSFGRAPSGGSSRNNDVGHSESQAWCRQIVVLWPMHLTRSLRERPGRRRNPKRAVERGVCQLTCDSWSGLEAGRTVQGTYRVDG